MKQAKMFANKNREKDRSLKMKGFSIGFSASTDLVFIDRKALTEFVASLRLPRGNKNKI
jgi:hypothetical protein